MLGILRHVGRIGLLLGLLGATAVVARAAAPPSVTTPASEKGERSAAEKKIDSQLLYALYARRGESAARGTPVETRISVDPDGRTLIDVRAEVTPDLLQHVRELGGTVVSTSDANRSLLVRFPLERLTELASLAPVLFIQAAPEPVAN